MTATICGLPRGFELEVLGAVAACVSIVRRAKGPASRTSIRGVRVGVSEAQPSIPDEGFVASYAVFRGAFLDR